MVLCVLDSDSFFNWQISSFLKKKSNFLRLVGCLGLLPLIVPTLSDKCLSLREGSGYFSGIRQQGICGD